MAPPPDRDSAQLIADVGHEADRLPTFTPKPKSASKARRSSKRTEDTLPDLNSHITRRQEDARARIAYAFVGGYLILLLTNIMVPVVLFLTASTKHPFGASDMSNLTGQLSAAVSSLLGVLGVVLGYYFKATTDERRGKSLRKASGS